MDLRYTESPTSLSIRLLMQFNWLCWVYSLNRYCTQIRKNRRARSLHNHTSVKFGAIAFLSYPNKIYFFAAVSLSNFWLLLLHDNILTITLMIANKNNPDRYDIVLCIMNRGDLCVRRAAITAPMFPDSTVDKVKRITYLALPLAFWFRHCVMNFNVFTSSTPDKLSVPTRSYCR